MRVIDRAAWGAPGAIGGERVPREDRDAFVLHYSTGQELGRDDCAAWVRQIRNYHRQHNGWADIGYNFLVCRHGDVFEGRGWDHAGAHSPGWNVRGIGVCFLGNDDPGQDVPEAARRSIRALWDEGQRLCGPLVRRGHRDTQRAGYTVCPGDELAQWLREGMPLLDAAPPFPGRLLRVVRPYLTGADVRTWQRQMAARGWQIKADGIYGDASATVCREFQRRKRLTVDGVVGPATWRAAWS